MNWIAAAAMLAMFFSFMGAGSCLYIAKEDPKGAAKLIGAVVLISLIGGALL